MRYGNAHGFTPGNTATKLLFSGEYYDSTATQYYLRARWYSPATGRFNRTDPFAGNNQDPQSLHKYLYVHNNPVKLKNFLDSISLNVVDKILGWFEESFWIPNKYVLILPSTLSLPKTSSAELYEF